MLNQQTLAILNELRLSGMAEAFVRQCSDHTFSDMAFEDRFGLLVDAELAARNSRRLKRLEKLARLKFKAPPEDTNYRHDRGLDKRIMQSLYQLAWIDNGQHVIFTGPTGCGKTWLACALAVATLRRNLAARYCPLFELLEEINIARHDGSLKDLRAELHKVRVLILDDWGLSPLETNRQRQDLFDVIDNHLGRGSLVITAQMPIEKWHEWIGEPTIADAIVDRLANGAHWVKLHGESMRNPQAKTRGGSGTPVPSASR